MEVHLKVKLPKHLRNVRLGFSGVYIITLTWILNVTEIFDLH